MTPKTMTIKNQTTTIFLMMNKDLKVDSSMSLAYLKIVLLKIKIIILKYLNDRITPAISFVTDKKSIKFYAVDY